MLRTKDLFFQYDEHKKFAFPDLNVAPGDALLILGESGVGKTTLLHLLAGILTPVKGLIEVDTHNLFVMGGSKLDKFRGLHIGLVYQKPHFIKSLTLLENLLLVQHLAGQKKDRQKIETLLDRLNLLGEKNKHSYQLSQGQQQRASIATAVVNDPKLLLADEPTSSLDDKNAHQVVELLKSNAAELQSALVIITHDYRLKDHFQNQIVI